MSLNSPAEYWWSQYTSQSLAESHLLLWHCRRVLFFPCSKKKNSQANPQLQTSCSLSVFFQGKAAEVNAHFDLDCPGNERRDDFCSNLSLSRDYSNLLAPWTSLLDHWLSQYWQALQLSENPVFLSGKSVQDHTATSLLQSEDFPSLLPSLPLPQTEQKSIGACPSSCSLLPFLWCSCYLLLEGISVLAFSILKCKSLGSCFHSHSLGNRS